MYIFRKKTLAILLLVIVIVSISVFPKIISKDNVLIISNLDTGAKIEKRLIDDTFVLGYTHSVLLTLAEEYFSVNENNGLVLQKTIYESFGVGLPFTQEKDSDFEIVGDKFILYIEREFKEINMIISPIPNHWIRIGDERIELIDLVSDEGARISIFVEDRYTLKFGKILVIF